MTFHNNPGMTNEQGQEVKKVYKHQPLTFDHYGIQCSIKENGKITLTTGVHTDKDGIEDWDEITIPASLVFKLVQAIQMTRKIDLVPASAVKSDDETA
jgi:hypothetical protein